MRFIFVCAVLSIVYGLVALTFSSDGEASQVPVVKFVDAVVFTPDGIVYMDIAYVGDDEQAVLDSFGAVRAASYDLTGLVQPGNSAVQYNPAGAPVSTADVEIGVEDWNDLGGPHADITNPNSALRPGLCENLGGDGQYTVAWGDVPGLAIGVACWSSTAECDQKYDTGYSTSVGVWRTVFRHEQGHCWGLGHEFDIPDAVMAPSVGPFEKFLHADDIAGFLAIYGASPNLPGDANCNGVIDPGDALKVLQIIAGLASATC